MKSGLVASAVLAGDAALIAPLLRERAAQCTVIDTADPAAGAVDAIRSGAADVLVKGSVDSASYLRAVVAKVTGLRDGSILSNLTLAEMPSVPRLIGATDNGIVLLPTLEQKRAIIRNALPLFAGLGVTPLRVAAIAASEKVSAAQPATTDAAQLVTDAAAGLLGDVIVGGPFGYDVAISARAATRKGIAQDGVVGRADLILFPSIEAANATAKAWKLHGQARTASIVLGARVPILLNSRSDGSKQRCLGLLLAAAIHAGRRNDG